MPVKRHTIFKNGTPFIIVFVSLMSSCFQLHAQCSASLKNVSYNTVLHGTGNNSWGFLIPQFNSSQETPVAVSIKAAISLGYSFSLENNSGSSISYNVSVKRRDSISSADLSSPLNNITSLIYGPII